MSDTSIFKKDLEKNLLKSKKAVVWDIIFTAILVIVAFAVWKIWNPHWWIYLLILWAGPFTLVGDLINILYCKRKLKP